jgi:hypothetical protein
MDLTTTGVSGVACINCYAYIGASVGVTLDYYSSGSQVDFEIKLTGRTGVNMGLDLNQPSVSGAQKIVVMDSQPSSAEVSLLSYAQVRGLHMYTRFGGLTMTVSGAGSSGMRANLSKHMYFKKK